MAAKTGILLVNVGTPDKPKKGAVRRYLFEFLNDRRVIDIPWLAQKILVNLIIIPFRVKKSTKLYQRLWTPKGSPLLIYLNNLVEKLQEKTGSDAKVYGAMRYGNPGMQTVLKQMEKDGIQEMVVLPLYPQYATSTTESVHDKLDIELKKWDQKTRVQFIKQFYHHPAFIEAFKQIIASYRPEDYDHVVFTYHGLPIRQINKMHPGVAYESCTCEKELPAHGKFCYKATCYATTRLLAKELALPADKYSVAFQSRLSNNWLAPFTDDTLLKLMKKGNKKVLVAAPSFVADCLETTVEIEKDYRKLFLEHGGQQLDMVHSLNDRDEWVEAILKIIGRVH